MAIVRYIGKNASLTIGGHVFRKDDRSKKVVPDDFVASLEDHPRKSAFEIIKADGGNVEIDLEAADKPEDETPTFPAKGFNTKKKVISFVIDELSLTVDEAFRERYNDKLALKTLNARAEEDFLAKFGGLGDDGEGGDQDPEKVAGLENLDTGAGEEI